MDDFGLDRPELSGTLISLEFGPGGRIQQLWASDPLAPDEHEEYQFAAPPVIMGEEVSEDYLPGTFLLGVRFGPDDPWVLARNTRAESSMDDEDGMSVAFEYDLGIVEEIKASGKFQEIAGPLPQIAWELTLLNRSRRSVEIGELGFPLALNNVYEGFPRTDDGTRELFRDRVYVHKFIGGAASYVYAQRMNARPPSLLIYPGEDTRWEFFNHVPASLTTPLRWEGIPVVYVYSRAAIEREGWPEWVSGHTSLVLEPGEAKTFHTRFVTTDGLGPSLIGMGRPHIRLFPAAVAPAEVGAAIEISGATPTRFFADVETELETDADENGGFCFVRPSGPGAIRVGFEDTLGRESEVHLLLTEPIAELIQRRADWIVQQQYVEEAGPFFHAIVPANIEDGAALADPESFSTPFGIESGLCDALFLAEKNTIYPEAHQIQILDAYLADFLEKKLLNPGDHSIGALLPNPLGVAVHTGRAQLYPLVACLYDSMSRIASGYGATSREADDYASRARQCLKAMLTHCVTSEGNGIPLMSHAYRIMEHPELQEALKTRVSEIQARRYPFNGESIWSSAGFEESFAAAALSKDEKKKERTLRYAFAARNASPSWWSYGSDKRWTEEPDSLPHPAMSDKGEMCLGPSTVATSLMFLSTLDRDTDSIDENRLRLAFGGLMGVWALVRSDGAAGMGFCPDAASRQFGVSWTTGDVGAGLYAYLRGAASYILPSRVSGVQTFGCFFEAESDGIDETFVVKPWDGIGRRIIVRHVGVEVVVQNGRITEFRLDGRKGFATLAVENTSDKTLECHFEISGLWGSRFLVQGASVDGVGGILKTSVALAARSTTRIEIKVTT
jgi:hypothetical protein